MKFGHYCLPMYFDDPYGDTASFTAELVDLLVASESAGFEFVWINEHHYHPFGGVASSPPMLLSAVAARTTKIKLGTSILVLPLHDPLQVAEQMATLDNISGGRAQIGVARGYVGYEYGVAGIDSSEAQARMIESLEVIEKAWTGKPFSHHGRFYDIPADEALQPVELWPTPVQRDDPPIWVGCASNPDSFRWTATKGYRLLTSNALYHPLELIGTSVGIFKESWVAAGHDPARFEGNGHLLAVVHEDGEEARRIARDALWRFQRLNLDNQQLAGVAEGKEDVVEAMERLDVDQLFENGQLLAGDPDECAPVIEKARDVGGVTGMDVMFLWGGITFEQARRSMDLFASDVMPRFAD